MNRHDPSAFPVYPSMYPAFNSHAYSPLRSHTLLGWRRGAEAGPMALRITQQGLEAVGVKEDTVVVKAGGRSKTPESTREI